MKDKFYYRKFIKGKITVLLVRLKAAITKFRIGKVFTESWQKRDSQGEYYFKNFYHVDCKGNCAQL